MSAVQDIESYIATYHANKYEQYKKLKYGVKNLNIVNPLKKRGTPEVQLVKMLLDPKYCDFTFKYILNQHLMPFQSFFIQQAYKHSHILLMGSRGFSKSTILGFYAMYRALIRQGSKIVIVGAGFRQSKMVFEVCEKVWNEAEVLREILGSHGVRGQYNGPHYSPDKLSMIIGDSEIIGIPVGVDGSKVRGFRANCVIADEFDSHNIEIYEKVIKGFGAVSDNPVEKVKIRKSLEAAAAIGLSAEDMGINIEETFNQEIISGTCTYSFANLGEYYKKYKAIIEAGGDKNKLRQLLPEEFEAYSKINSKNYCVFRVPYTLLPDGYLSKEIIDDARATSSSDIFNSEYGCVFMDDSSGFFKKSLIDSCSGNFFPVLIGKDKAEYVIGVDPAADSDNFAIVVLEVYKTQKRVVACYTTNRKKFNKEQNESKTDDKRFYSYVAKRIREIYDRLGATNVLRIDIDKDGGGTAVRDELQTLDSPIYEIVELGEPKMTDNMEGPHIVNLVKFQDYEWVSNANHNLKRDMEQKNLLFPKYDAYAIVAQEELSKDYGFMKYQNVKLMENETLSEDSPELLFDEIELMKRELTSIVVTEGKTGRESWGLPKRSEMPQNIEFKKDRYSALLIANAAANELLKSKDVIDLSDLEFYGGIVDKMQGAKKFGKTGGNMYIGNSPFIKQINNLPCGRVRRN